MKRDVCICKETCFLRTSPVHRQICQKRPTHMKGDTLIGKETHTYEKGPNRNLALMKRDPLLKKRDPSM